MATVVLGNSCLECAKSAGGTLFLHALILVGNETVHFQRDQNLNWHNLGVVATNCTAPPSLISGFFVDLVVDDPGPDSGSDAVPNYDGSSVSVVQPGRIGFYGRLPFQASFTVAPNAIGGSFSQATLVTSGDAGKAAAFAVDRDLTHKLDCLVLEGRNLVHWYTNNTFQNGRFGVQWVRGAVISSQATAAATCTKSPYRASDQVPFNREALVLEGGTIWHYWMDGKTQAWTKTVAVSTAATGPAALIVSAYRANIKDPGNLEALIPEGRNLVHYWRDDSAAGMPWHRDVVVSSNCSGPASLVEGGYGDPAKPNFEALVQEGNTVFHYWRDNSGSSPTWKKDVAIVSG
jgi:hypothetical protein